MIARSRTVKPGVAPVLPIGFNVQEWGATLIGILVMIELRNTILWLAAIGALAFVFFLLRSYASAEARRRRRREKSHRRVASRKQGPTVRLAVDVDKPKRERRG